MTPVFGASVETILLWREGLSVCAVWQEQYNKTGSATVNMTMKIILVTIIFVLGIVGYLLDCNNFKNIFNKDAHM